MLRREAAWLVFVGGLTVNQFVQVLLLFFRDADRCDFVDDPEHQVSEDEGPDADDEDGGKLQAEERRATEEEPV